MGFYTVLLVIHTIVVLFLILMVLIQRSDTDGMGGLGGGGGNQFMTGRASANLMTRITAILAAAFMVSSLVLAVVAGHMTSHSIIDSVPVEDSKTLPATDTDTLAKDKAPEEKTGKSEKVKATDKKAGKADKSEKPEKPAAKSTPSVPQPE